jgi:O-antigen ligase
MTAPSPASFAPAYAATRGQAPPRRDTGTAFSGPDAGATPRALVIALAAFLVINFARAHEGFWALAPLHLAQVTGVPLIILAATKLPRAQLRAVMSTAPAKWMMFIGLMMILSLPLSIWRGHSFAYLRDTAPISYMMFATTAAVLIDARAVPLVLRAEVLAAATGAVRMHLPGATVVMEGGIPRVLFGWTYDPNDTAVLFLVSIPVALYLANRPGARSLVWYAAALVMVVSIVKTGSRGGLLGMGAMLAALVLLAPPRQRTRLFGAGFVAALAFLFAVQSNPALRARFGSTFEKDYNRTATNGRVELWKRGMHYMVTHPVTGVGINNFSVAELGIGTELKKQQGITDRRMFTAHNSFVQVGAELGFPGLLAFLAVLATSARGLWRIRRRAVRDRESARVLDEAALASAVITSIVGLTVGGFFLSLAYSPMTYFTYALAAAVIARAAAQGAAGVGALAAGDVPVAAVARRRAGRRGGIAFAHQTAGAATPTSW